MHSYIWKRLYTPVCFVRTGRSAVRMKQLVWKMGKETGGDGMAGQTFLLIRGGDM